MQSRYAQTVSANSPNSSRTLSGSISVPTHGRDRPCCETGEQCPVKDVLREGTSQAAEHRHQDTKGEERYYDIVVYPIHSPSGEVEKVIHIAREITQRKQMEKERIRAERMEAINQLVATLSHEIYNPLTGLLWAFKDITDEKWIPADKLEYIRAMYEAAQRIRGVIEKMQGMKSDTTKEYVQGIRMIDLNEDDEPDCPSPDGLERS